MAVEWLLMMLVVLTTLEMFSAYFLLKLTGITVTWATKPVFLHMHVCMYFSLYWSLSMALGNYMYHSIPGHGHLITSHTCARGKVIASLLSLSLLLAQKSPYLEMLASKRLVSTTNQSNSMKNWLQCVSNRGIQSTSVTNSAVLLTTVATPIDSAHHYMMHAHCAFCSCTQLRIHASGQAYDW